MYIYTYIHIYIFNWMHPDKQDANYLEKKVSFLYRSVSMFIYTYIYMHIHLCMYIYMCIYIYIYICMHESVAARAAQLPGAQTDWMFRKV